jgi:hypothetical protein
MGCFAASFFDDRASTSKTENTPSRDDALYIGGVYGLLA